MIYHALYFNFEKSHQIGKCRLLQIIGGALWVYNRYPSHYHLIIQIICTKHVKSVLMRGSNEVCQRGPISFFFFCLTRGERIQLPLDAGHHRPTNEAPFTSWPNIECWLGRFVIFIGSGPVLIRSHIALLFYRRERALGAAPLDPRLT